MSGATGIAFAAGLSLGLSLIVAIGAQNAFVLRQGLKREGLFLVCLVCSLSDALLILAGVFGFHRLLLQWPQLEELARLGGGLFLLGFGLRSLWAAWKGGAGLQPSDAPAKSSLGILAMTLAFTWLNPHVYLDTLVLMGAVSTRFADQRPAFTLGAMVASFLFFFGLGYGARLLAPVLRHPRAWQLLDLLIAGVMLTLAWGLLTAGGGSQLL